MAARGMGVVYRATSSLRPLRRALSTAEREALLCAWYHPHHARLEQAVATVLAQHGRCRQDARVAAVMVEVNRHLYLNEADATPRVDFAAVAAQVRACWATAVEAMGEG